MVDSRHTHTLTHKTIESALILIRREFVVAVVENIYMRPRDLCVALSDNSISCLKSYCRAIRFRWPVGVYCCWLLDESC